MFKDYIFIQLPMTKDRSHRIRFGELAKIHNLRSRFVTSLQQMLIISIDVRCCTLHNNEPLLVMGKQSRWSKSLMDTCSECMKVFSWQLIDTATSDE